MADSGHERLAAAFGATTLLEAAPTDALIRLAGEGIIHRYRRGTYLFHQGDSAAEVCFLCEGRVEISTTSITGGRQLHATLEEGQFFGELGPLADGKRSATAEAVTDSAVWSVGGELFVDFVVEFPPVARAFLSTLARQVLAHEDIVEDLLFLDLKGRVAKRLLLLAASGSHELPEEGATLSPGITHADLGSLVGGSRESVSRILSDFQKRGLISRTQNRYVVTGVEALRRLAGL